MQVSRVETAKNTSFGMNITRTKEARNVMEVNLMRLKDHIEKSGIPTFPLVKAKMLETVSSGDILWSNFQYTFNLLTRSVRGSVQLEKYSDGLVQAVYKTPLGKTYKAKKMTEILPNEGVFGVNDAYGKTVSDIVSSIDTEMHNNGKVNKSLRALSQSLRNRYDKSYSTTITGA